MTTAIATPTVQRAAYNRLTRFARRAKSNP